MQPQIGQTISASDFAKMQGSSGGSNAPQVGQTLSASDFANLQKGSNPSMMQKVGGFLGNVASNIASGPAAMAARPGQLLGTGIAGLASAVTGNPDYYQKAINSVNSTNSIPQLGINVKPIGQETPESVGGEAASTVGLGVPNPVTAGATLGAGNAMQNNGSIGQVAGQGAVGGLLGGLGGLAAKGISKALTPASDGIEQALVSSNAATDVEAPAIAQTLRDAGVSDISNPTSRAIGQNALDNTISSLQKQVDSALPDSISGEFSPAVQEFQQSLQDLTSARTALQQVARVPAAVPAGPGLMSQIATHAGKGLLGTLKTAAKVGGLTLGAYEGTDPNSYVRKILSSGGL